MKKTASAKRWQGLISFAGIPRMGSRSNPKKITPLPAFARPKPGQAGNTEQGLRKTEDVKDCLNVQINYYLRTGKMDILCLISKSLMYIK